MGKVVPTPCPFHLIGRMEGSLSPKLRVMRKEACHLSMFQHPVLLSLYL